MFGPATRKDVIYLSAKVVLSEVLMALCSGLPAASGSADGIGLRRSWNATRAAGHAHWHLINVSHKSPVDAEVAQSPLQLSNFAPANDLGG